MKTNRWVKCNNMTTSHHDKIFVMQHCKRCHQKNLQMRTRETPEVAPPGQVEAPIGHLYGQVEAPPPLIRDVPFREPLGTVKKGPKWTVPQL